MARLFAVDRDVNQRREDLRRLIPRSFPLSLSRRIVLTAGIGLGAILALSGLFVTWAVQQTTTAAYEERVQLAQHLAARVDDVLTFTSSSLQQDLTDFQVEPGEPLSSEQEQQLTNLEPATGKFTSVSVGDAAGNLLWVDPTRSDIQQMQPSNFPAVQQALKTNTAQTAACVPHPDPSLSQACFAVPLHDSNSQVSGVLLAVFDPSDTVPNFMLSSEINQNMAIQIIQTGSNSPPTTTDMAGLMASEHEKLLAPLIADRTSGYRIHHPPVGPVHMVAYAPISVIPSWGVTLEEPHDSVVALPGKLERRLAFFGTIVLLLGMTVAWFDVRRIVLPLETLTLAAERFALGYLDDPIQLRRGDELGILARSFEMMRTRLRTSLLQVEQWNHELEHRVAVRTAEVEARNRELAQLNRLAETVSGSLDQHVLLNRTLNEMIAITSADAGYVLIPGDDERLKLIASQPPQIPNICNTATMNHRCLCMLAARGQKILTLNRGTSSADGPICQMSTMQSCIALPLGTDEHNSGVLFLGSREPDHFDTLDKSTLQAMGRQVGIALANARLYQQLQIRDQQRAELLKQVMNAQEEERRRLAQELHDETSQALASLQIGLERLGSDQQVSRSVRELADELHDIAVGTLKEVHRLAVELRPSVLDDMGLEAAIRRFLRDCAERGSLITDYAAVGIEHLRLLPAAETAIYRIVQGALTNVVQHAHAKNVSVLIERRGSKLVVIIEDDGDGFDLMAVREGSLEGRLGLAGMEERVALLGGSLTVETNPGAGTTVFLEIPIDLNEEGKGDSGTAQNSAR